MVNASGAVARGSDDLRMFNLHPLRIVCPACLIGLLALGGSAAAQTSLSIHHRITPADEERLSAALSRRGSLHVIDMPLHDLARMLGQQFQVNFVVQRKKLEEAAVAPDTPVTVTLENLPLESILTIVLQELELDFAVRDNVIVITTPDDLNSPANLETRVYPVRDLLTRDEYGEDWDSLIEMTTTIIDPVSWDEVGGPGSIDYLESKGTLVVAQTWRNHRHLERLLETLRRSPAHSLAYLPLSESRQSARPRSSEPDLPVRRYLDRGSATWQVPLLHSDR